MAKKTARELVLAAWAEILRETPSMSQVSDMWLEDTKERYRNFALVYKGRIYWGKFPLYFHSTDSDVDRREETKEYLQGLVNLILQHEQEGRFDRRGFNHIYPGMAR